MPRNLGTVRETRTVQVTCIDNGNIVTATLVSQYPDKIIVEFPAGFRLTMNKHRIHNTYIASHSGMEFKCNLKV